MDSLTSAPPKRFTLMTFGCRVNQYETQAIREQLLGRGFQEAQEGAQSDWVVVNSCTVTDRADRDCLGAIRDLQKQQPQARIVVTGCLVQRDLELLKDLPGVQLLVGSNQKHRIGELVDQADWSLEPTIETDLTSVYSPLSISGFSGRSKAFVKVQDGCDRACAFCKIPYVRGRSRSRPLEAVCTEVNRLVEAGFQEVVLTGVAIGLWGQEGSGKGSLAQLVTAVDQLAGPFRVRLSSLDPRDLDDSLIAALKHSTKVCHHLHLSLQSGSDAVLARMNRGHSTAYYQERVEQVRSFWPDLGLTTDWIVGFPGESPAYFEESLNFCRKLQFARIHVFPYSQRQGTSARVFSGPVPGALIKARARQLRELAAQSAQTFQESLLDSVQPVLAEEVVLGDSIGSQETFLTGYTSQFVRVRFAGAPEQVGQTLPIWLKATHSGMMKGEIFRKVPLTK